MKRPGIALVAALSLIALLGLLIAGAVAATVAAQRSASASWLDAPLSAASDDALGQMLADPDARDLANLPASTPATFTFDAVGPPAVRTTVTATRLPGDVVWLVADARLVADTLARRRVSVVARFRSAGGAPAAAISHGGSAFLAPDVSMLPDTAGAADCRGGAASIVQTTDSTTLYEAAWQRSALDSTTNVWRIARDTVLGTGSFAGVVVADADLRIDGPFAFTGLMIVRGALRSASGLSVTGAIAVHGDVNLAGSVIRFSPCAVALALRRGAPLRSVRGRAWAELF